MTPRKTSKSVGRPRAFDPEKALDAALKVFWRKGYEGTSLSDLTQAMGINRPSLYAAFGDKEALFRKVLVRYAEGPAAYLWEAFKEPTARAVAEQILYGSAELLGNPKNPRGCLMVQGALACGDSAISIQRELVSTRKKFEEAIVQRLKQAKVEGDLPADSNPSVLAHFLSTVTQGMSVEAASGASRKELRQIAQMALRAWPQ
jgi:AcrR family transcriptional regulator